eukprot:g46012.t1
MNIGGNVPNDRVSWLPAFLFFLFLPYLQTGVEERSEHKPSPVERTGRVQWCSGVNGLGPGVQWSERAESSGAAQQTGQFPGQQQG